MAASMSDGPKRAGMAPRMIRAHRNAVTIWAITSTVSGNGDTGADPNRLVAITDNLKNTSATKAASEKFFTLRQAGFGEALRGVSFTPGTDIAKRSW